MGIETKVCSLCGIEKPIEAFYMKNAAKGTRHARCKTCHHKKSTPEQEQRSKEWQRRYKLMIRYGITPEQYEAMYEEQHGLCAICSRAVNVLHVDHDHATSEVRQLLCSPCNTALGLFGDNPDVIRIAATYLERHAS